MASAAKGLILVVITYRARKNSILSLSADTVLTNLPMAIPFPEQHYFPSFLLDRGAGGVEDDQVVAVGQAGIMVAGANGGELALLGLTQQLPGTLLFGDPFRFIVEQAQRGGGALIGFFPLLVVDDGEKLLGTAKGLGWRHAGVLDGGHGKKDEAKQ